MFRDFSAWFSKKFVVFFTSVNKHCIVRDFGQKWKPAT